VFGGKMCRLSDQNFDQIKIGSLTRFMWPSPDVGKLGIPSSEICPRNQARSCGAMEACREGSLTWRRRNRTSGAITSLRCVIQS
jgi:hypothetical protein